MRPLGNPHTHSPKLDRVHLIVPDQVVLLLWRVFSPSKHAFAMSALWEDFQ